jgi:hypothetical protein
VVAQFAIADLFISASGTGQLNVLVKEAFKNIFPDFQGTLVDMGDNPLINKSG